MAAPDDHAAVARVTNPVAAGSGSFALRVTRADREQELKTIATSLPPGSSWSRARPGCAARRTAPRVDVSGQNGKRYDRNRTLETPCARK